MHHYSLRVRHPWHGISCGDDAPTTVNAFIEIVPTDSVKYEIDKESGHLMIDRPQKFSNYCPSMYGFIPQTICRENVAAYSRKHTGRTDVEGDNDPIDICVLSERPVNHGTIIVHARPIGGFRLFDGGEADDKIIAVLVNDPLYGKFTELPQVPEQIIDRLRHYFVTYKSIPEPNKEQPCVISHIYGRDEAHDVIRCAMQDYQVYFQSQIAAQKSKEESYHAL